MRFLTALLVSSVIALTTMEPAIIQGSRIYRFSKSRMLKRALLYGGMISLIFLLGNRVFYRLLLSSSTLPRMGQVTSLEIMAVLIFTGLGFYFIYRGLTSEPVEEKRQDDPLLEPARQELVRQGFIVFSLGMATAFINLSFNSEVLLILLANLFALIMGIYLGYWYGNEKKNLVNIVAGIELFIVVMLIIAF